MLTSMRRVLTAIVSAILLNGCEFTPKLNMTHKSTFELYTKICNQQHTHRKNPQYPTENASGLFTLNNWGINFVGNLYDFLQDDENIKKISEGIELSVKEGVEHSGYADVKNGNIELVISDEKNTDKHTTTILPLKPIIGMFHYHAWNENCTDYAGPSGGPGNTDLNNDAIKQGMPGIVITKLKGKKFNVDAYFGSISPPIVIDLGNYEY